MDLDAAKAHLQSLPPHVAVRRTATLLTQALAEIKQLRTDRDVLVDWLSAHVPSIYHEKGPDVCEILVRVTAERRAERAPQPEGS